MEAQDWAGEEEELPGRREESGHWGSQEGEEPGARRESSNHSFDSESLPGELVIAELEPLGAVQVGWMDCWKYQIPNINSVSHILFFLPWPRR